HRSPSRGGADLRRAFLRTPRRMATARVDGDLPAQRRGRSRDPDGDHAVDMLRECWCDAGQAGATARLRRIVSTYSTSEMSTCLVDSRFRASQLTTGMSLEIASASRTSCASWYCMPSKQLMATRY